MRLLMPAGDAVPEKETRMIHPGAAAPPRIGAEPEDGGGSGNAPRRKTWEDYFVLTAEKPDPGC